MSNTKKIGLLPSYTQTTQIYNPWPVSTTTTSHGHHKHSHENPGHRVRARCGSGICGGGCAGEIFSTGKIAVCWLWRWLKLRPLLSTWFHYFNGVSFFFFFVVVVAFGITWATTHNLRCQTLKQILHFPISKQPNLSNQISTTTVSHNHH